MTISKENKEYLTYIGKYLGVALIAGSVVHVGTLQNGFSRYVILGTIGLIFILLGNIYEAKQKGEKININYLLLIIGLSLATGFLSGGIQHYLDNPSYAGILLGIGFFMTYITYFIKEHIKIKSKNILIVFIFSVLFILFSNYVMDDAVKGENYHSEISSKVDTH